MAEKEMETLAGTPSGEKVGEDNQGRGDDGPTPSEPTIAGFNPDNPEAGGELPPSYHDEEPPPSYDSLFKQAKSESSGKLDYLIRVIVLIFCGTVCTIIYLALSFALPIVMVTIGAIYKEDCPAQKFIPIYLIVGGTFGMVVGIVTTCSIICCGNDGNTKLNPCSSIINGFLMIWFTAGNYWVYRTYTKKQFDDPTDLETYCDKTLYLFAFWLLSATYIAVGLGLLFCCGLAIYVLCDRDD